ncbi:hypothetical protein AB1282_20285 [Gottfriedia sp. S16(2024)]|uniref:hypothetical protein n=1 Tax=Gottfriedia sp. S16(2024) TaxID=3162883 RepID=UPI003D25D703
MKNFLVSFLASVFSFILITLVIVLFYILNGRHYTASELTDFVGMWVIGAFFILGGCAIGEGLFIVSEPAKLYHFILLGLVYGGIIYALIFFEPDFASSSDFIFLIVFSLSTAVGSAVFYVFRRKAFN